MSHDPTYPRKVNAIKVSLPPLLGTADRQAYTLYAESEADFLDNAIDLECLVGLLAKRMPNTMKMANHIHTTRDWPANWRVHVLWLDPLSGWRKAQSPRNLMVCTRRQFLADMKHIVARGFNDVLWISREGERLPIAGETVDVEVKVHQSWI